MSGQLGRMYLAYVSSWSPESERIALRETFARIVGHSADDAWRSWIDLSARAIVLAPPHASRYTGAGSSSSRRSRIRSEPGVSFEKSPSKSMFPQRIFERSVAGAG